MGGKKKLTLKQLERTEEKKGEKEKKGGKGGLPPEKKAPGIIPPDLKSDKIVAEIKKMKVLTPYSLASRFNLRISVARDVLDELASKGAIEYVSGSRYLKIYKPHD